MSYLGDRVAVYSVAKLVASFVGVGAVVVCVASYCLARHRTSQPGLNIRGRHHHDLGRPPVVLLMELDAPEEKLRGDPGSWLCSVCLGESGDGALRLLPNCGHVFHQKCIDSWLRLHPTCPMCRVTLTGVVPV